jgi:hypothetical protein
MPSVNFQKQFAPGVLAMLDKDYAQRNNIKPKTTTIRAMRKRPFKKGDKLILFSGLRTKYCQRLGIVVCLRVEVVVMETSLENGHLATPSLEKTSLASPSLENVIGSFDFAIIRKTSLASPSLGADTQGGHIGPPVLGPNGIRISIDGVWLTDNEAERIARQDGFEDWKGMAAWFGKTHGFPFTGQRIHMANTYDRRYYLHKVTKDLGINLHLDKCEKTIEITTEQVELVRNSKHISELAEKFSYGVQIMNPLMGFAVIKRAD